MLPRNPDIQVVDPAPDRPRRAAPPHGARTPVMLLLDPFLEIHDGPACEVVDRPRPAPSADAMQPGT